MASEAATRWLRIVNTMADTLEVPFEEALGAANVPPEVIDEVRELRDQQARQIIRRVRGVSRGGPRAWYDDWDPARGFYWGRQRAYLLDQVGRSPEAVDATDDDSNRVLSYLEDPRPSGPDSFDVRGLVVGHVQSGKTENFSALIAKASDLGYQLIIVLSGIHNELRQQTQRRLERELGLSDIHPGVGLPPAGQRFINPTWDDINGDFQADQHDPAILQGNERVIVIVKKWWTVLEALNGFIDDADMPAEMPVLVIDDEADQASINTGGNRGGGPAATEGDDTSTETIEDQIDADPHQDVDLEDETNPSKTNALIRELLSKFQRSAYVAYTATPFANVLIQPDAVDREVWRDLFPKDFILTLEPRPGYVGATRLFGRDALDGDPEGAEDGLDVIRLIPDHELADVSPKHAEVRVADFEPSVPPSLEYAIRDWVLATAGVAHRMGADHPSTMLIHIHQRTTIQNALKPLVEAEISSLRREWRYDRTGAVARSLETRWNDEFAAVSRRIDPQREHSFADVEQHIDRLFKDPVPVLALNSDSEDRLDFRQTPDLKAILIGGNRLSRGVTVEGLTVSFFVRESPAMDTLLQMCRWFGYREPYVDLTRLWTSRMLASWFRDIALREEELRQQIHEAECERLPPDRVGYRIRSHPAMMVTSQAKMGAGEPQNISYAGKLIQTSRMRLFDTTWLEENLAATVELFEGLGDRLPDHPSKLPVWADVDPDSIVAFLRRYRSVQDRNTFDADTAADYIEAQRDRGELGEWTVTIRTQTPVERLGTIPLGGEEWGNITRTRLANDETSVGVLSQPAVNDELWRGDEEVGLEESDLTEARNELAAERHANLRAALIARRSPDQATLIIYPISPHSTPRAGSTTRKDLFEQPDGKPVVIGAALVFPNSESAATIEYISGGSPKDDEEQ